MKKDRNSFFGSTNFNMNASGMDSMLPYMQQMMPNTGIPNINAASSSFYAANNIPGQMPNNMNMNMNSVSSSSLDEIEARLSKLERSINRLDARLNKLEGSSFYTKDTYDTDGNMYMV